MAPDPEDQLILQKHLAQFLVKDVFNTITEDDILKIVGTNLWSHKGNKYTPDQVRALRAEASAFKSSGLWRVLRAELLWKAQEGYKKSKGEADLVAVKVLELLVETIDKKLEKMIVV